MQSLSQIPPLLLLALVVGTLVLVAVGVRLTAGRKVRRREAEDPRWRRIRELEADHRLLQRKLAEAEEALASKAAEVEQRQQTELELNTRMQRQEAELKTLRQELHSAVTKTNELRQELSDRAAESIRQHALAEEAQTELAVMRAGSEAVVDEYSRLQAEREQLAGRMSELEQALLEDPAPPLVQGRSA